MPIISFIGCEKPTQPNGGKWTISGNTYLAGLPEPASGVLVKCAGISTTSGTDGSYELRGVPEAVQILTAERADCQGYSDTIDVKSDTKRYIYLRLTSTKLWGFVTNPIDGSIEGAKVVMRGLIDHTDASGRYELPIVPQGTDTLYISHPDYIAFKAALTLTTSERECDVVLSRDRILEGTVTEDTYVDESQPNANYGVDSGLLLSTRAGNRKEIYLKFQFPELLRDSRVSILEGSLQLWIFDQTPSTTFSTYAVVSPWTASYVTWNSRPAIGPLLYSGSIGDGSTGRHWSILGIDVLRLLLVDWLANRPNYGIAIQGGDVSVFGTGFYSTESYKNPPRLTFKVHY